LGETRKHLDELIYAHPGLWNRALTLALKDSAAEFRLECISWMRRQLREQDAKTAIASAKVLISLLNPLWKEGQSPESEGLDPLLIFARGLLRCPDEQLEALAAELTAKMASDSTGKESTSGSSGSQCISGTGSQSAG
jgi:hypothetical protein